MTKITDQELYDCRDCRVWDPASQPSVQRQLELNPEQFEDRVFAVVHSGMSLTVAGLNIPLSVELITCERHALLLEEEGFTGAPSDSEV